MSLLKFAFSYAPRLPPELYDRILDHLHDDPRALSACSLTCRSWLPTSRFHLFQGVRIHSFDYECFLGTLRSSPVIGRYVTSLRLHDLRNPFLPDIMQILQSVATLALTQLDLSDATTMSTLATLARSLTELRLHVVTVVDLVSITELAKAIPRLRSLHIINVTGQLFARSSTPLPLQHLHLSSYFPALPAFTSFVAPKRLRSLCIESRQTLNAIYSLVMALGPRLETLEVRAMSSGKRPLPLTRCSGLRRLELTSLWLPSSKESEWRSSLFPVTKLLSEVETPSIRSILLSFSQPYDIPSQISDFSWASMLERPLSRQEFAALQDLTIEFRNPGPKEREIEAAIRRRIPTLHARGIVSVRIVHTQRESKRVRK